MKQTLIVQTGYARKDLVDRGLNFDDMFKRVIGSDNVITIDVFKGERLPEVLNDVGHVIVTGSMSMITERTTWMLDTEEWLRRAEQAGIPILGVCFGHQMLAVAFGGEVANHPEGTEVGTDLVRLSELALKDPLFRGLSENIACYVSHTQSVIRKPDGAIVLGGSDFEKHHILKFSDKVYGLQFHPEFTDVVNEDGKARSNPSVIKELDQEILKNMNFGLEVGEEILKRFMKL